MRTKAARVLWRGCSTSCDGLNRDLQVPSPRAYGIDADRYQELLPVMAEQALASGSPANNPRVPTADEIIELYQRVYE